MKRTRILSGILAAMLVLLAAVSACADLKKGSRGEEVKELQQQMIDLGVLEGSADGIYGKKTEAAVKKLQQYWGKKQNGRANQAFLDDLNDLWHLALGNGTESGVDPEDLEDGKLFLTILSVDHYADADVKGLAVGDQILIDGETLTINSVGTDEYGDVQINGGLVEDGYDLTMYDGDDVWTVAGLDDYPTWTAQGETTLPLDDAVSLIDGYNGDDHPITADGLQAVTKAIEASEDVYFDEYSTKVTVKSGKIVLIHRIYTP